MRFRKGWEMQNYPISPEVLKDEIFNIEDTPFDYF